MSKIIEFDLGCRPSPSVPAETLLQDGSATFLLFWAVSNELDERGKLRDLGVAVVQCQGCVMSRFGYPNDEGLPEHPLYREGISNAHSPIMEVLDSLWADELKSQMEASRKRIWKPVGLPPSTWSERPLRHFLITLKERTFECLAQTLTVVRFYGTFDEAFAHVLGVMRTH